MIFTGTIERENTMTIDGYSKAKTVKGAIADLSREVAKYNTNEAEGMTQCIDETIAILGNKDSDYWVECEEVPCATKYINDEENEYKEANYYIAICYVK